MDEMAIYTIYDSKAEVYSTPWFAANDAVARRNFQNACESEDSDLNKHAEDFSLFFIGIFHIDQGEIVPHTGRCIAKAIEFQVPQIGVA